MIKCARCADISDFYRGLSPRFMRTRTRGQLSTHTLRGRCCLRTYVVQIVRACALRHCANCANQMAHSANEMSGRNCPVQFQSPARVRHLSLSSTCQNRPTPQHTNTAILLPVVCCSCSDCAALLRHTGHASFLNMHE